MLASLVRRTWAPRGQTPVMYCWDRHDRLSVVAGLSLAAKRRRIGLYFAVHDKNVTSEDVEVFLRHVQRQLGRALIVVMDRWAVHRKAAKALFGDERFWVEYLPPRPASSRGSRWGPRWPARPPADGTCNAAN